MADLAEEQLHLWAPPAEPDTSKAHALRYYQLAAREAIEAALENHQSTAVVMATGLGKTRVISDIVHRSSGRVLCLAHRSELVDQMRERLEHDTGERIGLEQAEFASSGERIVVGSIQSVYQPGRLERVCSHGDFDLLVIDELHHYVAKTYKRVVQQLMASGAKTLGVTATPDRGDRKALGQIIQSVCYRMDILEGIEAGYLVPIDAKHVTVSKIDLRRVRAVRGDLHQGELEQVVLEAVEGVVKVVAEGYPDRKGILFFPGKLSARAAADRLVAIGKTACVITDDTPKAERRWLVRQLKSGKLQYLCNCGIATEGFDWPECSLVVNARPTKSRALYAQIAGRGTRTLPGVVDPIEGQERAAQRRAAIARSGKPDMVLLDLVGNSGKHKLVTPVDMLGGRYTADERKVAKKMEKARGGGDPLEYLKAAREELKALAEAYESAVKYQSQGFDPFRVLGMDPKKHPELRTMRLGTEPPSQKQMAALEKWGIERDQVKLMSRAAAKKFIGTQILRKQKGLASYRILKQLQRFGVTRTNVSQRAGLAAMEYLKGRGWGKMWVDPDKLNRILDGKE